LKQISETFLVVQAGGLRCALPVSLVREIMRPLPVRSAAGLGPAVRGVSVIRGTAMPVVSLSRLLGQPEAEDRRFVVLRTPGRDCALSVEQVHALTTVKTDEWQAMPRLLSRMESAAQILAEDEDLMVSLNTARLIAELPPAEVNL
jgi:purine-binding chemotaxis protein CheW